MPKIFEYYKPLRNLVRQVELGESLFYCWQIANYLCIYNNKLPDIDFKPQDKGKISDKNYFRFYVVSEWDLEFLVQEIIMESPKRIYGKKKSIKNLDFRNNIVDKIRSLQDFSIKDSLEGDNVLIELNRMAHRQFLWQTEQPKNLVYRYYKIFSYGILDDLVRKNTGFSTLELMRIGLVFFIYFNFNHKISLPPANEISFIGKEIQIKFLSHYSKNLDEIKNLLIINRKYDHTLFYNFNPLRSYPLIKLDNTIICPIPMLLLWQISSGIYYLILKEKEFDNEFGVAFQKYVLQILKKVLNDNFMIYEEEEYGIPVKRTADIIVEDKSAIIFIECKTKRMTYNSKTQIDYSEIIESDIIKFAEGLTQLYKTIEEYKKNNYPNLKYKEEKKVYPLLITLENWYIGFNPKLIDQLSIIIQKKLADDGLNIDLKSQPYYLRSIAEFEEDIQIIAQIGIKSYFDQCDCRDGRLVFKDFNFQHIFAEEFLSLFQFKDGGKLTLSNSG